MQTAQRLQTETQAALQTALAAEGRVDAATAVKSANQCQVNVKKISDLIAKHSAETQTLSSLQVEVERLAKECRIVAERTHERELLADKLGSLKLRAYRGTLDGVLIKLLEGLAVVVEGVARQETSMGTNAIPDATASVVLDIARMLSGNKPDGTKTNWSQVALEVRALARESSRLHLALAAAWMASGMDDLALCHLALPRKGAPLITTNVWSGDFALRHLVSALVLRRTGFPHLSRLEMRDISEALNRPRMAAPTPEMEAGMRLMLGLHQLDAGDREAADREIAKSMRLQPNNPFVVFLTGERLLADGQREKAARALEAAMADTEDKEVAEQLARRARDIRDGKAEGGLLNDPKMLVKLTFKYLAHAAKTSDSAMKLEQLMEYSRKFAEVLWEKIPGVKPDATAPNAIEKDK